MSIESRLENPIYIRLGDVLNVILADEHNKQDCPLYPGAVIGTEHYGFVLLLETSEGQKEVWCPTQNKIDAIGIEDYELGDLKVFENGKHYPWVFTYNGHFKSQASNKPFSRGDKFYTEDVVDRFALKRQQ